jgi:YjbE family integral membrane protein
MDLDWGTLFHIEWNLAFLLSFLNILFIDLILSGDNAVLIAMAVHNLPEKQRMKGIALGTLGAVVLRVLFTCCVALLLDVRFIKLVGGALILWIAFKLFTDAGGGDENGKHASSVWQAVRIIIIADLTMALDNMLAVGGAAHGNLLLLMLGLAMSIPMVVFTSKILSTLMDKYPVIIMIGGAILGKVGGDMIITDPFMKQLLNPSIPVRYAVEILCAVGVIVVGKMWIKWQRSKEEGEPVTDYTFSAKEDID